MKKKRDIMNPVIGSIKPLPSSPTNFIPTTTSLSPMSNSIPFLNHDPKGRKEKKGFDFANLAKSVLDEDGESKINGALLTNAIDRHRHPPSHHHHQSQGSNLPPVFKNLPSTVQVVGGPGAGAASGQLPATYHNYLQTQLAFFAAASAAHFIPGFSFPPTYVTFLSSFLNTLFTHLPLNLSFFLSLIQ